MLFKIRVEARMIYRLRRITDKILPIVKEWQERPLEEIYAVVFMDAIHYHCLLYTSDAADEL